MPDTNKGMNIMKKKIAIVFAVLAVFSATIITLCSFTPHNDCIAGHEHHTHVSSQGKRCNGTVGCDCPGFSPITSGKVWQESYCKHCGHHKNSHK